MCPACAAESAVANPCIIGRSRDGLYEPVLADTEREAVADLLQYLENVRLPIAAPLVLRIMGGLTLR